MNYLTENLKSFVKILLGMYGTTALLLFFLAFLLQKLEFSEGVVSVGISAVYVISCFLGGVLAGKVQKARKFLWGIFMGIFYLFILMAVTLAGKHGFTADLSGFIVNLCLCAGAGMLGGMIA